MVNRSLVPGGGSVPGLAPFQDDGLHSMLSKQPCYFQAGHPGADDNRLGCHVLFQRG